MGGKVTITRGGSGVTNEEIAVLCGWPPLDGFVVVGIPLDENDTEIRLACDTHDLRQVHAVLAAVVAKLETVL